MNQSITLDFLVNYFSENTEFKFKEKKQKDKFNLNILESYNSKNFKYFNNIFEYFVDRVGIRKYHLKNKEHNISLLYSLLHCLNEDFCTFEEYQKDFIINSLKTKIKNELKLKNKKNLPNYILKSRMNKFDIESIDVYIYACYFNINIIVFDFNLNSIQLYYPEDEFIPYKINILISKKNNLYQPLTYKNDNSRYFKYNSTILENIIYKNKLKIFSLNKKPKIFNICKNFNYMLKKYDNIELDKIVIGLKENELKNIISSDSVDDVSINSDSSEYDLDFNGLTEDINNIIIDTNTELVKKLKGFSKSKLSKEKKSTLIEYLSKLNNDSNLDYTSKTKKFILNEINSILNKSI